MEPSWLPDLLCKHWFTSSVWNFCRWVADVPSRETSPASMSEEKRMFSQVNIFGLFCYSFIFPVSYLFCIDMHWYQTVAQTIDCTIVCSCLWRVTIFIACNLTTDQSMICQQLCNWPIGYSVSGLTEGLCTTKESAVRLFSSRLDPYITTSLFAIALDKIKT